MKVFEDKFTTKTPERLRLQPQSYKELQEAAKAEVQATFPTSVPEEVHPFFYRDPYRYAAMMERIMSFEPNGDYIRKAYHAFYQEETIAGLMYPEEW